MHYVLFILVVLLIKRTKNKKISWQQFFKKGHLLRISAMREYSFSLEYRLLTSILYKESFQILEITQSQGPRPQL